MTLKAESLQPPPELQLAGLGAWTVCFLTPCQGLAHGHTGVHRALVQDHQSFKRTAWKYFKLHENVD